MITKFKLFEYINYSNRREYDFSLSDKLGITKEESEEIYNKVAEFYMDNPNISFLGSGSYGSVFSLDDKVLKITTDDQEIESVEYLRKKIIHGIVDYYDIRKINLYINDELYIERDLFAIIMDKVEPLDNVELECYRILYRIGYIDKNDNLSFTYTLNHEYIGETSPKNFRKLNDGSRAKIIYEIIKNAENYEDYTEKMKNEFGNYVSFEFVDFEDLQESPYFEETFFRFYKDILDLLCDVIKYELELYDSHEKNVGKDKNGHFKMVDIRAGSKGSESSLKLKPITISIKGGEEFMILQSKDGINFKYYGGGYDSIEDAIDDLDGDIDEKYMKINGKQTLIFYDSNYYYRVISNIDEPEIFDAKRWKIVDPNQLSLNL